MATDHLLDVSNWNNPAVIDWAAVQANGIVGVSVKVTQGTYFVDATAAAHANGARSAGLRAGGYHFGDCTNDAAQQAATFADHAAALGLLAPGSLAPMYDVENTSAAVWPDRSTISHHVNMWLDELVRRGVDVALVYGSLSWWQEEKLVAADWARDDIRVIDWIAVYNGDPGNLDGFVDATAGLHQHTSSGNVDGIPYQVDKSVTVNGKSINDLIIGGADMSSLDEAVPQQFSADIVERLGPDRAAQMGIVDKGDGTFVKDGVDFRAWVEWGDNRQTRLELDLADVAADVKALKTSGVPVDVQLSDDDVVRVAKALADELDRRARDNDPATGPTS